ncbi:MAG: hypothetical protein JXA66_06490 [Oligoflexia bacterium]|nr:hypothetical protein [Oligoflexia bacterium]
MNHDSISTELLEVIFKRAVDEGSRVLSKTFRAGARIDFLEMKKVNIQGITADMSNLEGEFLGAFVNLLGVLPFKLLFMIDKKTAFLFTDLYLKKPIGTTVKIDSIVTSVMQELGNIIGSAITNIIYGDLNIESIPEPPNVVYDYAASIFSSFLMSEILKEDRELYIIETVFTVVRYKLAAKLYLLPDSGYLSKIDIKWE